MKKNLIHITYHMISVFFKSPEKCPDTESPNEKIFKENKQKRRGKKLHRKTWIFLL